MFKRIVFILCVMILAGCQMNQSERSSDAFQKLSTEKVTITQQQANEAEKIIQNHEDVTSVEAVNSKNQLVVAFEIKHLQRFRLEKIKQAMEREIQQAFPSLQVTMSTDKKILLELEKLKQKIHTQAITDDELIENVQNIISLSKEQT